MPHLMPLRSILRLLREQADRRTVACIFASLLLVAIGGALAALSPLALKHLVDALDPRAKPGTDPAMLAIAATYLLVVCGGRVTADLRPLLAGVIDQRLQAGLRQRFFEHVMRLPISYLLQRRSGELIHSLDLAAAGFQSVTNHLCSSLAPALIELLAMVVVLVGIGQPAIVGVFASTAILYLAIFSTGALRLSKHADQVSSASLAVYAHLSDSLANVETLRCFTAEKQAQTTLREANEALGSRWLMFNRLNVQVALAISTVFTVSLAACLWITTTAAAEGRMTTGSVVLASVYMLQMVRPLEVLGSVARDLARTIAFTRPLIDLLGEPMEPDGASAPTRQSSPSRGHQAAPSIRFENVRFGYDPSRPVIQGLSLQIRAGSTTAIVGPSGSGKSSLARLLLRLHSPQAGSILFDERPLSELSSTELRASIGLVPQEAALLHGSITNNVALGVPHASHADIEAAIQNAQLHDLVDALPLGCNTRVGDRGMQLSGGERQRVAIARAILRRPSIYLLDEPTSMLDSKTEAAVMQRLRQLTVGCTTVVIAHRLSTVMHADEIVVMDQGRVHARGRHDELLAQGGLYTQLWRRQTEGASPGSRGQPFG